MESKPQAPPKLTGANAKAPPSKPKGIKGWGRVRVGVGAPEKKPDAADTGENCVVWDAVRFGVFKKD